MKTLTTLIVALMLFVGAAPAQAQCTKNLGGLTDAQFGRQADQLAAKIDKQLVANTVYTFKTIIVDGVPVVVPATLSSSAKVDVTREHPGVLSYTICNLTRFGFTTSISVENRKSYLIVGNYRILN